MLHARYGMPVSRKLGKALKRASHPHPGDIRFASETLMALFDEHDKDIVLSNENISIQPSSFWSDVGSTPTDFLHHVLALQDQLGDITVRVILGTRRQDYWLASRYAQSARSLPRAGQEDFDNRVTEICAQKRLSGPLEWLLFGAAQKTLADGIGSSNLLVVPMEDLEAEPQSAVMSVGHFIGNRDLGPLVEELETRGHFNQKENQRRLEGLEWKMSGSGGKIELSRLQSEAILTQFAELEAAKALEWQGSGDSDLCKVSAVFPIADL